MHHLWGSSEPADTEPAGDVEQPAVVPVEEPASWGLPSLPSLSAVSPVDDTGGGTRSLEERLEKLEAQAKQHSDSIEQLSSSIGQLKQQAPSSAVPDTLSIQSAKGDVDEVVDAMRRDLASQRKILDAFHEKLQPILSSRDSLERLKSIDPRSLRSEFVSTARFSEVCADMKLEMKTAAIANQNNNSTNNSGIAGYITAAVESTLGKQQGSTQDLESIKRGLENYFVGQGVFNETVNELRSSTKADLAMLHSLLEHTALKAGYLAIAVSECAPEEKTLLFETLKGKEREIGSTPRGTPAGVQYPRSMSDSRSSVNGLMQSYPPPLFNANRDASTLAIRNNSRPTQGEIVIDLQRQPNMKLGMSLDGRDERSLVISGIGEGLVSSHNASAMASDPSQALQVGDRIVAVNGVRGSPAVLVQETREDKTPSGTWPLLQLTIIRGGTSLDSPRMISPRGTPMPGDVLVTLASSPGMKLGLSVDCDDHQTLLISRINEGGRIEAFNDSHPGQRIMPGDRIVMANGKRGDPKALLEETHREGELSLGIIRNSQ